VASWLKETSKLSSLA